MSVEYEQNQAITILRQEREIETYKDELADARIIMRQVRKMLKDMLRRDTIGYAEIVAARKLLKEGLKEE